MIPSIAYVSSNRVDAAPESNDRPTGRKTATDEFLQYFSSTAVPGGIAFSVPGSCDLLKRQFGETHVPNNLTSDHLPAPELGAATIEWEW